MGPYHNGLKMAPSNRPKISPRWAQNGGQRWPQIGTQQWAHCNMCICSYQPLVCCCFAIADFYEAVSNYGHGGPRPKSSNTHGAIVFKLAKQVPAGSLATWSRGGGSRCVAPPPPTGSATFATCFATLHQCFATFHICCAFWRFRCVCGLVFLSFSASEHLVMLHNRQKAIKSTTKATKSTTKAIKSTTKATKTTTKARNAATHY
jgi:hypothetical protein